MTKTCISITGGVDSTYLLYKTLSETQDEVTAFHIDFTELTPEVQSALLEKTFSQNVVNWLKTNVRDFTFENIVAVSKEDMRYYSTKESLKQGQKYLENGFDKFLISRTYEDIGRSSTGNMAFISTLKDTFSNKVFTPLKDLKQGKPHAIVNLPKNLYNIILKCGKCVEENGVFIPCGKCEFKCKYVSFCENMLSMGWSADKVLDYYMKVTRRGPYVGLPGKGTNWYL